MVMARIQITIPPELLTKLERIAKKEERNVSNMVSWLIKQYKED